jgi:hypothetical protein
VIERPRLAIAQYGQAGSPSGQPQERLLAAARSSSTAGGDSGTCKTGRPHPGGVPVTSSRRPPRLVPGQNTEAGKLHQRRTATHTPHDVEPPASRRCFKPYVSIPPAASAGCCCLGPMRKSPGSSFSGNRAPLILRGRGAPKGRIRSCQLQYAS